MLNSLANTGHVTWTCQCGAEKSAHISHDEIQYANHDIVGLPVCSCGTRTFLKVKFSDAELQAPNMIDADGNPTDSHAAAHRHMSFHQQLQAAGKQYVPRTTSAPAPMLPTASIVEQIKAMLGAAGISPSDLMDQAPQPVQPTQPVVEAAPTPTIQSDPATQETPDQEGGQQEESSDTQLPAVNLLSLEQ